jgi:hypothetical protein
LVILFHGTSRFEAISELDRANAVRSAIVSRKVGEIQMAQIIPPAVIRTATGTEIFSARRGL